MTTESGPAGADIPRDLAHRKGGNTVDTTESSAAHAHPPTDDHDDTVEAHYSGLDRLRPCACMNGTVFIGHLVVGEDGEEVEAFEAVPQVFQRGVASERAWAKSGHALAQGWGQRPLQFDQSSSRVPSESSPLPEQPGLSDALASIRGPSGPGLCPSRVNYPCLKFAPD